MASDKVLFLLGAIRSIYGIVRNDGLLWILNLNCAIGNLIFLILAFRALGRVYMVSGHVLRKHKRFMGRDKWFRRFLWSCWALRFEIAHLYFVDPPMSLTMGSLVLEKVANMLVLGA